MPRNRVPARLGVAAALQLLAASALPAAAAAQIEARPFAERVEIVRTAFGVPHIRASDIGAAYYGLAWVQLEDAGPNTAINLVRARGEMGRWFGRDSVRGDFQARLEHATPSRPSRGSTPTPAPRTRGSPPA